MEYPNPGVRIVSFGAGRFSGAQEFKRGAWSEHCRTGTKAWTG